MEVFDESIPASDRQRIPAATLVILQDGKRVEVLLGSPIPHVARTRVCDLGSWREIGAASLPMSAMVEWSGLWVRLAELANEHASPAARALFALTLTELGDGLETLQVSHKVGEVAISGASEDAGAAAGVALRQRPAGRRRHPRSASRNAGPPE